MVTLLNIIVVEDHDDLRDITVETLRAIGHQVVGVDCAEALVEIADSMHVDLMLIDLNLPGEDGISLAQRIRQGQPGIGIIMLTARGKVSEKLQGYASGADLYLTKPTTMDELGAAVQALSRRLRPAAQTSAALKLDLHKLTLSGQHSQNTQINLSAHEGSLLAAFARAPGQRLEHWQLIALLGKVDCSKAGLEMQIARLRKKLVQVSADEQPIKVIRQVGYQLSIEVQVV
ncbi:MAG: transcriptional regulator [Burkholderiales bacterium RIFOXYD12_FULL_59_19]|nr:MAG: transcriptional regulator [Burkholderiales bacterium RIFOXYD12_FULL_59_19]